jgi:exportin-2 (importin alpha re-exporter)
VLDLLCAPLTELFTATFDMAKRGEGDLLQLVNALLLISKIFLSLNSQDLPEFFEDHMEAWMQRFAEILALPDAEALASEDPAQPGVLEELKTEVLESVTLYALK